MKLTTIKFSVTEPMTPYVSSQNDEITMQQRALLLYPYIHNQIISHGRAAELLGISKWDLINLYGKMGIPYIDYDEDEIDDDIRNSLDVCTRQVELSV